jgi:glycerophosphoryl diester phosphodiesterase
MSTLETDVGVSADGVPMLSHEHTVSRHLCRQADSDGFDGEEPLITSLTAAEIQSTYRCDRLLERFPEQQNAPELSPVALAYVAARGLDDIYVMPSLAQLFDFVSFYRDYYRGGEGRAHESAAMRWQNADRVRYNVEIKRDPRPERVTRTAPAPRFARAVTSVIVSAGLEQRADVQSFDLESLFAVHEIAPMLRTAFLFDDHNLGRDAGDTNPWLAGLTWPYRDTALSRPFSVQRSGGLEGMALSSDGTRLYPMLEKPLEGDESRSLYIFEFDLGVQDFTQNTWRYVLDEGSTSIGDFVMLDDTRGLVIERDDSEGDLEGFKVVYEIARGQPGTAVAKTLLIDLLNIPDPEGLAPISDRGDVGLGERFAFPYFTIECLLVLDPFHIAIANDNNFPLSVGRHVGTSQPDDNEIIVIELAQPLM